MFNFLSKERFFYIKVYTNRISICACDQDGVEYQEVPEKPFSTPRLLVGDFFSAEKTIRKCLENFSLGGFLRVSPVTLIHGVDQSEGGYSQVEERVLNELAYGAGSRKVVVWYGKVLECDEVIQKIKSK